jgi:hypothetical protein
MKSLNKNLIKSELNISETNNFEQNNGFDDVYLSIDLRNIFGGTKVHFSLTNGEVTGAEQNQSLGAQLFCTSLWFAAVSVGKRTISCLYMYI